MTLSFGQAKGEEAVPGGRNEGKIKKRVPLLQNPSF